MPAYLQAGKPLSITTPLGEDALLLTGIRGREAVSELFSFQLDLLAELAIDVSFDRIVGQNVTVALDLVSQEKRFFNGIVKQFTQCGRQETFVHYRAELVPKLWLLTKSVRSRVFQHITVPDILRQVLSGFEVDYEIAGTYYERDYCVQYRESDFDFISRLMEEEGIYYFFHHTGDTHKMIATDLPTCHPPVEGDSKIIYEELAGGIRDEMRITAWEKTQELRSGEYTLWDHCFELPGNHLEAKEKTMATVAVGETIHNLNVGGNDRLEIYDYPGGYAQRFDAVDRAGEAKLQDLQDIFRDKERTVRIRMEQEEVQGIRIRGTGNCGHFAAGHKFALKRHFDADDQYLLTSVEHTALLDGTIASDTPAAFSYENRFTCIPAVLPYRPQRVTSRPVIAGVQTATVTGPAGEEIFCDKYGRVKVQFHRDREGKKNADSSCWLRVAQVWAGKSWGAFFWPRIGHEVVVTFEEGDPDQPLIIGSLYNAENLPPYELPKAKMFSGIKSQSVRGSAHKNFNGILFVDKKGQEHLSIHSERHLLLNAEWDKTFRAGRHTGERVPGARMLSVGCLLGGGSGGGPDKNLWPSPEPQGVLGLNASVVYGGNFQVAMPLNFQMALGSNVQICINPAALANFSDDFDAATPPTLEVSKMLGGGLGGNMQLTFGTNTNFVMGQSFDINLGPKRFTIDVHAKDGIQNCAQHLSNVITTVSFIFILAYGLPSDDLRAVFLIAFQYLMEILLSALMDIQRLYQNQDVATQIANKEVYDSMVDQAQTPWMNFAEASDVLTLVLLPLVLDSLGEASLDSLP